MKISKLTISTFLIFLFFAIYKFLAPKGICDEVDLYMCNYNMDSNIRIGYFFLIFSMTSLVIDSFFKTERKNWLIYSALIVPPIFYFLTQVNAGVFHTNPAGSGGWGDIFNQAFDRIFAIIGYTTFAIGSIITVVVSRKKNKKTN